MIFMSVRDSFCALATSVERGDDGKEKHKIRSAKHHKFYIIQSKRKKKIRESSHQKMHEKWSIRIRFRLILCKNHINLNDEKKFSSASRSTLRCGLWAVGIKIVQYIFVFICLLQVRFIEGKKLNIANKHIHFSPAVQ